MSWPAVRFTGAAAVATILCVAALILVSKAGEDTTDPGKHSAFTREELRTSWKGSERSPLLLPQRLPDGAEEASEAGFVLENVSTDPVATPSKRVWVSSYGSDVLGGIGTSFRVFQRPADLAGRHPCGRTEKQPFLQRRIGDQVITICSPALSGPSPAPRRYWKDVPFTSDLDRVAWLEG
jgi:hypothetical protein